MEKQKVEVINKEHFRTLRKAIENNKLAIFVGSAVSYDSKLPSWGDLISLMKNALENPRTDDYLKIAEHFYLQYGRNTYYSKINEFFPSGSQPNLLHELILQLKPQHIVTTNWDNLLEKAIENRGELYFKVASDHELASSPSSQLLVKMHGDLSHRNIIFKESDYLAYTDKFPLIENFIKSLFSTHVVLFIGYSISDYNLNQILSWIRNRTQDAPPSFTILTENKITLSECNYLREKGVYPLLREDDIDSSINHTGLSTKSIGVANTLKKITHPEDVEASDILVEILSDVSNWKIVYPSTFVQLVKDRLNVIEVNKIYYSPDYNIIVYNLSAEEQKYTRAQYRKIRTCLVKLLSHIPIIEFQLSTSKKSVYRIKNPSKFEIPDEYTTFDFKLIKSRSASASISLSNNLDDGFQFAFDNYYLKKLAIARDSFMHVANRYFLKSNFIKSLVSSFNKKQLSFGEIPWDLDQDFFEVSMQEQLSRNDNISEMIDKFPKSITSRQKPLFQGLDASNSFLLERFKKISNLSREIDDEIKIIKKGGMAFSNKLASMYNQANAIILFVIKNKISLIYSSDYKNIARIAFESIVKRMCLDNKILVDETTFYLAAISFKPKNLTSFLSENLQENESLQISKKTFDYAFKILENCLSEISSSNKKGTCEHASDVWSNALIILSYARHEQPASSAIINHLVSAVDTNRWATLSEIINRFIVVQFNRYGNSFSVSDLKMLFDKQMQRINSNSYLPIQERGALFSSLIYLIKDNHEAEGDLFKDNKELSKFIMNVSLMDLDERLRAISGFVFAIHSLATGVLKNKTTKLLKATFSQAKEVGLSESSIIFALNLDSFGVLEQEDLKYTLSILQEKANEHISKGSTSTSFQVIKDQLSAIDASKLKGFEEVVEQVTQLSDSMENAFKRKKK
jgi:hypothetical protein